MEDMTLEEREYEALVIVRDALLVLRRYVDMSAGKESERLRSAFDHIERLTEEVSRSL